MYVAMAGAFGFGYERRTKPLATILVPFCAFIEIAQLFVPGRHARLLDFVIDENTCASPYVARLSIVLRHAAAHRTRALPISVYFARDS